MDIKKQIKRIGIFFIVYTIVFFCIVHSLKYILPFIIAGLTVTILKKPVTYLINKLNFNSTLAIVTVLVVFYTIVIFLILGISFCLIYEIKNVLSMIDTHSTLSYLNSLSNELVNKTTAFNPEIINSLYSKFSDASSHMSGSLISIGTTALTTVLSILKNVPYIFMVIGFAIISTYFMLKDTVKNKFEFKEIKKNKYFNMFIDIKNMLLRYCASYSLVIFITFIQILILLLICKVPNALLMSIVGAILDVLPIVGTAIIIIPLGLYYIVTGAMVKGIIILCGYVVITIVRHLVEPKIVSSALDINPLSSIVAIFIGLTLGGIVNILYCIFLVVSYKAVFNNTNVKEEIKEEDKKINRGIENEE